MEYKHSYKNKEHVTTSLSVFNSGYQQCTPSYVWGPAIRDHYLIHYVATGKGKYCTGDKEYEVNAGQLFLSYPDTPLTYSADEESPWEYYWVGFNGSDARILLNQTDFTTKSHVIDIPDGETVKRLLLEIYEGRGNKNYEQAKMAGNLFLFLAYLMENSIVVSRNSLEISNDYLRYATEYIAHNYSNNISIEDISHSVGISRSGLYRTFIKHLGISPIKYLTNFRISQACSLLRRPGLSIEAVACSVGFEDPLYFSRVFKANMGISPRKYSRSTQRTTFYTE